LLVLATQIVYLLYNYWFFKDNLYGDLITKTSVFLNVLLLNSAVCVFIFIAVEIWKGLIYMGYPYLNLDLRIKAKYKKNVLKFWVFGKFFSILICSFLLISTNMTGHSWSSIEELLTEDATKIIIFFAVMTLESFFTEIVNVLFTLDDTFIESFDPEEVARESSLLDIEDKIKIEEGLVIPESD